MLTNCALAAECQMGVPSDCNALYYIYNPCSPAALLMIVNTHFWSAEVPITEMGPRTCPSHTAARQERPEHNHITVRIEVAHSTTEPRGDW